MYYKQKYDDGNYGSYQGHGNDNCFDDVFFFPQCGKKKQESDCCHKPEHRPEKPACNICDLINWKELFKCCCNKPKPKPEPKRCFCYKCCEWDCKD